MSPIVSQVAKALHVPTDQLIRDGILSYVERQVRLTEEDIADLREKYLVSTPGSLQVKIKKKSIPSHPAWEDVIEWENLEVHLRTLQKTLQKLG